ncbi:M28 family peptidase, partial [Bacteroidota bacterium]
ATTFWESEYVYGKMKEYGLEGAKIIRYPGGSYWDGIKGELWEVSPGKNKLADYDDITAMLASGSVNTDVTAEIIWVGEGRAIDIEGIDVNGKILLTSGSASGLHRLAVPKGALGVVSFASSRSLIDPLQISGSGIGSRRGGSSGETKFGFNLPPREGHILRDRLKRGQKITVHATVESSTADYEMQVPTCVIPGTDPNGQEIIFSAHLFEGYTKQGANDNISGCAAILEVARMLKTLIDEGRIPQPKRTIRFIHVPEFSGTGPWVNENKELMKRTLCNINLDMVGLWLSKSQSFFNLMRTTYGNPHYINDVMENFYRYVGETNIETINVRGSGGKFPKRIVAPSGSDEPFYYRISQHYGASDHEVFNDWGVQVPGIMMITWPDFYYHTSQDRADKCDPTQLKRVAVIAAAAAYTIASADDDMAVKLGNEVLSNGSKRLGLMLSESLDDLEKSTADNFAEEYKSGKSNIEAALYNEINTVESVNELAKDKTSVKENLDAIIKAFKGISESHLLAYDMAMKAKAKKLGQKAIVIKLTKLEKEAMSVIPKQTSKVLDSGYGGSSSIIREVPKEIQDKYPSRGIDTRECARLVNGKNNALMIKKMLDAQSSRKADLQLVLNYLQILKHAGLIEI